MFASRTCKWILAATAGVAVFLGGAGAAQAVLTGQTGGSAISTTIATQTNGWPLPAASSGVWVNVPGMVRPVTVGSGTTRLLVADYNAESLCTGSGWCSVRIVAINSAGGVTEFHPQSGTDFAFDSDGDNWSSHSIKRSIRVGAGTWRVQVQAARVAGSSTSPAFRLDEHFFDVDVRV